MGGRRLPIPPAGERAWDAFWALSRTRNANGWMPNRLTLPEIAALPALGFRLASWEVVAVLEMDAAWAVGHQAEVAGSLKPPVSERQMTPALFDALF